MVPRAQIMNAAAAVQMGGGADGESSVRVLGVALDYIKGWPIFVCVFI